MAGTNKRSTAIHEAGHFVVAYRYRHDIHSVSICPKDESQAGVCVSEAEWADGSTDREQIVVLFAGAAAELHAEPNTDTSGSWGDEERAGQLLALQPAGTEAELRMEAAKIVAENWQEITAVATALLEGGRLSADEATIIVDAIDDGEDWPQHLAELRERQPPQ